MQQTSENVNKEVMDKLSVKNKEVRALCQITEEKEFELCTLCKKLTEQECKYSFYTHSFKSYEILVSCFNLFLVSAFSALLAEAMKVAEDAGNAPQPREENLALHKKT